MQQYEVTLFYEAMGNHKGDEWCTFIFFKTVMPFVPTEGLTVVIPLTDTRADNYLTISEAFWNVKEKRFEAYIRNDFTWPNGIETFLADCAKCGWEEEPDCGEDRLAAQADDECK